MQEIKKNINSSRDKGKKEKTKQSGKRGDGEGKKYFRLDTSCNTALLGLATNFIFLVG